MDDKYYTKIKNITDFHFNWLFSYASENRTEVSGEKLIEAVQPLNLSKIHFY